MAKAVGIKTVAQNRRARHDFFIEDSLECGMELKGTEVKSLRQGHVNLKESYAVVKNGEVLVLSMHISPYEQGNIFNVDPMRPKRLLLHKSEIRKLQTLVQRQGYTLIPLDIYLKDGRMKMNLGVCVGKHLHDKRAATAARDVKLEMARTLREQNRGD
ncbi:MAG: SsrA-binding protein SmpB [Clostridiales bacterium]|nr:SsrA-binding protein SmpB [Clostridiales bacterium]